jgi:hypothetical protein
MIIKNTCMNRTRQSQDVPRNASQTRGMNRKFWMWNTWSSQNMIKEYIKHFARCSILPITGQFWGPITTFRGWLIDVSLTHWNCMPQLYHIITYPYLNLCVNKKKWSISILHMDEKWFASTFCADYGCKRMPVISGNWHNATYLVHSPISF